MVNYLNNKDILKEIHKSKLTYCSFIDDSVKSYDSIVAGVDKITKKAIQEARKARAERLAKEAQEADLLNGVKKKLDEYLSATKDIPQTDVHQDSRLIRPLLFLTVLPGAEFITVVPTQGEQWQENLDPKHICSLVKDNAEEIIKRW
jgi:hypothetical protein